MSRAGRLLEVLGHRHHDVAVVTAVKRHLANARSKVGAETTAQLVWILALGL